MLVTNGRDPSAQALYRHAQVDSIRVGGVRLFVAVQNCPASDLQGNTRIRKTGKAYTHVHRRTGVWSPC